MTSHCITWHDTTQAITSHQMTWPSHDLTPEQTSRHQNTSLQSTKHHHHGRAEGSFTAKKWFGHRAGRSPCAHSIGKFFLCYIVLFLLETSAPGLSGHYWYTWSISIFFPFLNLTNTNMSKICSLPFFLYVQIIEERWSSLDASQWWSPTSGNCPSRTFKIWGGRPPPEAGKRCRKNTDTTENFKESLAWCERELLVGMIWLNLVGF